jgi:23S rRNA-/tRNA-specific pseudouridylate synthase
MTEHADQRTFEVPVLWQTEHEAVLAKPAGMATELTSDPKGVSLLSRVRVARPEAKLPHRLDRVTRGLVVVALTKEAIAWHNEQIRDGAWEKIYLARVRANVPLDPLQGTHTLHLKRAAGRAEVVRCGGKRASTEILAWAPTPDRAEEAHVLIRLLTGRYHQIRATLAHLGAPLVDDWLYGVSPGRARERFYLEHVALRFVPCGESAPRIAHWREDPDRESIAAPLRGVLDALLAEWEPRGRD